MGTKYATHEVRKKIEGRLRDMKECKENPMAWQHITDKQQFLADEKKSLSALEDLTPPDTTGTEKDGIKRRLAMLNEALVNGNPDLICPMPSHRQCWDNSPATPGKIVTWNRFWKTHTLDEKGKIIPAQRGKGAIWEAKDKMRVLNKERESEDPDVANLETIRPRDVADPLMDVSRRSYGLTPAARANYEETFPDHEKTDVEKKLESAEADKMASLLARIEELETRASLKESKRKKRSERMKNQWAEKRAKAKGALDVAEAS